MSHTGYIVDTAILQEIPQGVAWHAETPAGSTKSLVAIDWHGSENFGAAFEARPDVLRLVLWETLPAEAADFFASFEASADETVTSTTIVAVPIVDVPTTPDTASSALRKTNSAVARLIR